jgi:hypothetical protein
MYKSKKILLAAVMGGLALFGTAYSSHATTIEYSAVGLFANNTNVYSFGDATLTFDNLGTTTSGVTVDTDTNNPTNANFGTFVASDVDDQNASTASEGFTLSIYQFVPDTVTTQPQNLVGTLTGVMDETDSNVTLNFTSYTVTDDNDPADPVGFDIFYNIFHSSGGGIEIVPASSGNGTTTIQGQILSVPVSGAPSVPLPASLVSGSALLGLIGAGKLLRRPKSA